MSTFTSDIIFNNPKSINLNTFCYAFKISWEFLLFKLQKVSLVERTSPNGSQREIGRASCSCMCVARCYMEQCTPSYKELIQWHFRLGHIGFQQVQWLIRTGYLKVQGNYKAVANCERPKCAACEFGKCRCQPN